MSQPIDFDAFTKFLADATARAYRIDPAMLTIDSVPKRDPLHFRTEYTGAPVMEEPALKPGHWHLGVNSAVATHTNMLDEYDRERTKMLFAEPSGEITGLRKEIERHEHRRSDTRTDI